MDQTDKKFIEHVIAVAKSAESGPKTAPVACIIVHEGNIIGEGVNEVTKRCDATAHAEIVAMRRAGKTVKNPQFKGATLYSTLQPCGMCSMAAIWAGISRIVYGAQRGQVHEMYFEDKHLDITDYIRDAYKDDLILEGGLLGDDCAALYYGPDDHPPENEQANR